MSELSHLKTQLEQRDQQIFKLQREIRELQRVISKNQQSNHRRLRISGSGLSKVVNDDKLSSPVVHSAQINDLAIEQAKQDVETVKSENMRLEQEIVKMQHEANLATLSERRVVDGAISCLEEVGTAMNGLLSQFQSFETGEITQLKSKVCGLENSVFALVSALNKENYCRNDGANARLAEEIRAKISALRKME